MHILKPCSFCGAHGRNVIEVKKETYLYDLKPCTVIYVKCIECGGRSGYAASEQEARGNWNKRK